MKSVASIVTKFLPRWNDIDEQTKLELIYKGQLYLRAAGPMPDVLFIHPDDRHIVMDLAERAEMDRDFIEDRLSFIASGLTGGNDEDNH